MNFVSTHKKFWKITLILTIIFFWWFSIFGLTNHMSNMKPDRADGNGCLFNIQMEVCTMNLSEHITFWQGAFTSLPQNVKILELLILAIMLSVVINFRPNQLIEFLERMTARFRLYIKQNPQIRLFNLLIEEFARGILNPKIFVSITI